MISINLNNRKTNKQTYNFFHQTFGRIHCIRYISKNSFVKSQGNIDKNILSELF